MTNAQKISSYLELSSMIAAKEREIPSKEREYQAQFHGTYEKLKRELSGYFSKIKPTVETICGIYKTKVAIRNNKIALSEGILCCEYTAFNAPEAAIKLGSEAIKLLAMIVQKNNVDTNLREFARRYNTVVDIYINIDSLKAQGVKLSVDELKRDINELKLKKQALCASQAEFNQMVNQVASNSDQIRSSVIINDKIEFKGGYDSDIVIPVAYEGIDGSMLGRQGGVYLSALNWCLNKDGFLVLRKSKDNDGLSELSLVANNAVLQFLFAYPQLSKRVLLCDGYSTPEITTLAGSLRDNAPVLFFEGDQRVKNSKEDIRASITQLNKTINERIMLLGQSRYDSILEYNKQNQDNPQPIILAVLNGYPSKYEDAYDDISSVLSNGKRAGVFFLIIESTETDEDSRYYTKRLPSLDNLTKNIVTVKCQGGRMALIYNGKYYHWDTRGPSYNVRNILSAFKSSEKTGSDKTVYLDSIIENESFASSKRRTSFSKNLSIPIGKKGAAPISIELRADSSTAHMAVIGTTGSGKTAFINSLVLSACKHYSPDELELHMMVMTKGDFVVFKDNGLPHLKTVVTGNDTLSANDILDFLNNEMSRRTAVMKNQDIYVYNQTAQKKMPRCVVIIDEFSELVKESDEAIKQIEKIAQMGRSFGISLIVSSTVFPVETNAIKHLFGNRIEFKSGENAGQLIPEASEMQSTLVGSKGLCFYSNGGSISTVKVAYSEEGEKLKAHINSVKAKYPSHKMELQSEIKAQRVENDSDAPFTVRNAALAYDEEGILRTRLGKAYLTNKSVEFPFDSSNNTLFIFGHFLETKAIEAALIKDTLALSKDIDNTTAYYINLNKNNALRRHDNIMKRLRDAWETSGKVAYGDNDSVEDIMEELKSIIDERETDMDSEIYPILVVMTKADEYLADDDKRDELKELMDKGKENNIYFVVQCTEYPRFFGVKDMIESAIILPDRVVGTDEGYSSAQLCAAFEEMAASQTPRGTKLLRNASSSALHPKLHLLCIKNKFTLFIPYDNSEGYLKSIVD